MGPSADPLTSKVPAHILWDFVERRRERCCQRVDVGRRGLLRRHSEHCLVKYSCRLDDLKAEETRQEVCSVTRLAGCSLVWAIRVSNQSVTRCRTSFGPCKQF